MHVPRAKINFRCDLWSEHRIWGGRRREGGSESVSLQEDNSNCSQNEEMYILYFYTETIMISSESIQENSTLQIKGQTNSAI